jgi:hypothetical protein
MPVPPRSIRPAAGSRKRSSSIASVVLPDPLGPVITRLDPAGIDALMSRSA